MWGDKGEFFRGEICQHEPNDGCMWCCETCNYDRHICPGCGTIIDHNDKCCEECEKL